MRDGGASARHLYGIICRVRKIESGTAAAGTPLHTAQVFSFSSSLVTGKSSLTVLFFATGSLRDIVLWFITWDANGESFGLGIFPSASRQIGSGCESP